MCKGMGLQVLGTYKDCQHEGGEAEWRRTVGETQKSDCTRKDYLGKPFILPFRGDNPLSLLCINCGCWLRVADIPGTRLAVCSLRDITAMRGIDCVNSTNICWVPI